MTERQPIWQLLLEIWGTIGTASFIPHCYWLLTPATHGFLLFDKVSLRSLLYLFIFRISYNKYTKNIKK